MAKKKTVAVVTATPVTKKPAISNISRSSNVIKSEWTKGETLSGTKAGQKVQCQLIGTSEGTTATIITSMSSYSFTYNTSNLYPTAGKPTTNQFVFTVANKTTGKLYSDYAAKTFPIYPPEKPTLTAEWGGSEHNNRTTFTWSATDSENAPLTDVILQTVLKENCPDDIKGLSEWASATATVKSASDSTYYDESNLSGKSLTRCVRVKARGIGGDSEWEYASNTYAAPYASENYNARGRIDTSSSTMYVETSYNTPTDSSHPVEKVTTQYLDTVPGTGLTVPSGAAFTDYQSAADTNGVDGMAIKLDFVLSLDHVLFTRVKSEWNGQTNYSATNVTLKANLKTPSGLSVQQNQTNYKATVTATNNSDVPDSYLAIYYMPATTPPTTPFCVGYIAHGSTSAIVQCPNWSTATAVAFGVKAIQGSTPVAVSRGSYDVYTIATVNMESDMQKVGGTVPVAPTSTSATQVGDTDTVLVKWNWPWTDANLAEISWADHIDAWESTDEPSKYEISNLHAAQWRISGLELGKKWYVRVRLGLVNGDDVTYGPYCNPMTVDLAAAPDVPVMRLSNRIVKPGGKVTAEWVYGSNDGTLQNYAEIFSVSGTTYTQIANTKTAQHITLDTGKLGWSANTQHTLAMRVWSDSNKPSPYSATTVLTIANPLTCTITTSTGFATNSGALELRALPATITVTGAGTQGTTTLVIERAQSYDLITPDEETHTGYDKETIFLRRYPGAGAITINQSDLIGRLDDTAPYRIVATVEDTYGQTAQATQDFTVQWTTQAVMPTGTAVLDTDNEIVKITPTQPVGASTGATVDIYRLSADKPQLIYKGASFGTTYVDPYPTIGEYGGYRLVYMTANGDFITSGMVPAVLDIAVPYDIDYHIINFGKDEVGLTYNLTASDSWEKSFQQTRYLGGSIEGYWLKGATRSGSASTSLISVTNKAAKSALRRLAAYTGICHVRTRAGSNYTANVNVSEDMSYETAGKISQFTLDFQGCDNPALDGMTLSEWEALS